MELFNKLFGNLLAFVYHCFDRIVIHGYLSALSRPEQVVHFFRQVLGIPVVSKEILSQRTADYQNWVEAFARIRRDQSRCRARCRRWHDRLHCPEWKGSKAPLRRCQISRRTAAIASLKVKTAFGYHAVVLESLTARNMVRMS